jgi:hypothetical protein
MREGRLYVFLTVQMGEGNARGIHVLQMLLAAVKTQVTLSNSS